MTLEKERLQVIDVVRPKGLDPKRSEHLVLGKRKQTREEAILVLAQEGPARTSLINWLHLLRLRADASLYAPAADVDGGEIVQKLKDSNVDAGVITLVDSLSLLGDSEVGKVKLMTQIRVADVVGFSGWEDLTSQELAKSFGIIMGENPTTEVLQLPRFDVGNAAEIARQKQVNYSNLLQKMHRGSDRRAFLEATPE